MSDPAAEKELTSLKRLAANKACANCNALAPHGHGAVCMAYATFVCHTCKSAHQSYSHLCKSVSMSFWTKAEVAKLRKGGNERARAIWQAKLDDNARLSQSPSLPQAKDFVRLCYIEKRWYDETAAVSPGPKLPVSKSSPAVAATSSKPKLIAPHGPISRPRTGGRVAVSMAKPANPEASKVTSIRGQVKASPVKSIDLLTFEDDVPGVMPQGSTPAKDQVKLQPAEAQPHFSASIPATPSSTSNSSSKSNNITHAAGVPLPVQPAEELLLQPQQPAPLTAPDYARASSSPSQPSASCPMQAYAATIDPFAAIKSSPPYFARTNSIPAMLHAQSLPHAMPHHWQYGQPQQQSAPPAFATPSKPQHYSPPPVRTIMVNQFSSYSAAQTGMNSQTPGAGSAISQMQFF